MAADTDNEMKCISDNSINIEVYRKLVQTYLSMNLYTSALFWADKVVALSSGAPKDIYWLAQCMFLLKQYHRAAQLIRSRELEKNYVQCNYLVVRCLFEAHEYTEAMRVLNSMVIDIFQPNISLMESCNTSNDGFFDESSKNQMQSAVLLLKGRLFEAMDNRGLASECFRQALQYDVYCFEAYEALVQHQMLSAAEERDLLDSIPLSQQCTESEALFLKILYESKLKKYHSVTENFPKDVRTDMNVSSQAQAQAQAQEMICLSSATTMPFNLNAMSTPQENSWTFDNNIQVSAALFNKIQGSLDLVVSQAEKFYYNCEYQKCKKVTENVLKKDPYHTDCLPVHIACLVELKESNNLFSLAHKLVDLYPDLAIAWFAVGCYYYVIGKSDPARRYLSKATTLDRLFGPAWLAYGHSFAVENEHDQAMAAYFKASQLMKGCHLPLLYIGLECGLTNNVRLAEKFFQQAQNIAPDDPFVMHEMGVIAFQNLDYKSAEKHFKEALNRIRNNQDSTMVEKWEPLLNNLGHACRKLKKYDESLEYHHQALVLSPQNASTYSAIGYTKALMGFTEEAVDWFHRALGLRRDDTFSTTMLNYAIEQLADESPPYRNAPNFIPDFSLSSPKVAQEDIFIDTSDADVTGTTESQSVQQDSMNLMNSDVNMSMSFEIEMPDADEEKT